MLRFIRSLVFIWAVFANQIGQTATCPTPTFDPATANIHVPCLTIGNNHWSVDLNYSNPPLMLSSEGMYWKLSSVQPSSCDWSPTSCASTDQDLNMTLPLSGVIADTTHIAKLQLAAFPEGMFWRYQTHYALDKTQPIVFKQTFPNSKGAFSELFVLDGDLATASDEKPKELLINDGTVVPKSKLATGQQMTVKIYHFNDLHNTLQVINKTKGDTHYFSQMAKIVGTAKAQAAENEIVLFLSAGDDHVGTPFDELWGYDVNSFKIDPAYHAYSEAGLDAAVIGNHELDRGTALLAKSILTNAKFPILSANLYGSSHLQHLYFPAVVGVAKGLRIALIGVTTQEETLLRQKDDPQFGSSDILKTLQRTIQYVDPFADVIIILSHLGYNGKIDGIVRHALEVGDVEVAKMTAKTTAKPALVIGGHMHLKLNEQGLNTLSDAVPILEAGAKASHLGEAVLSLYQTANGLTRSNLSARLIPLKKRNDTIKTDDPTYASLEHDADVDQNFETTVMQPLYALLADQLKEVIGEAGSSSDLTTEQTYADRYLGETLIANFMNDAIVAQSVDFPEKQGVSQKVDIAVFNASGLNGGVQPNSQITFNDWYSVMPYADMIVVAQMTGQQIKDMVMSNAQRVVRPEELLSSSTPVDLTTYISRGFLHFSSGLTYTIKLNGDATQAVAQDIMLQGQPIDSLLDKTFNVAFGDYISLRGGEGWNGKKVGAGLPDAVIGYDLTTLPKNDTGLVYRNEVISFIKKNKVVNESSGAKKDGRLKVIP